MAKSEGFYLIEHHSIAEVTLLATFVGTRAEARKERDKLRSTTKRRGSVHERWVTPSNYIREIK